MKTEPISKEQVKLLRKSLGGIKRNIDWDKIDYNVGRGIVNKTKYCLWTIDGNRIEISVTGKGIVVSQSKREDPEYYKLKK